MADCKATGWKLWAPRLLQAMVVSGCMATQLLLQSVCLRLASCIFALHLLYLHRKLAFFRDYAGERAKSLTGSVKTCTVCRLPKPPRFYHCRSCERCSYRMDHHCDWVGNCISATNLYLYVQLLALGLFYSFWLLLLLVLGLPTLLSREVSLLWVLPAGSLILLSLLACFETHRLLRDQWEAVCENQTLVETFKKVRGKRRDRRELWRELMGDNALLWLLPVDRRIHANITEDTFR